MNPSATLPSPVEVHLPLCASVSPSVKREASLTITSCWPVVLPRPAPCPGPVVCVSPTLFSGLPTLPLLTTGIPSPGAPGNIPWFAADCPAPRSFRCGQSGRRPGGRRPGAGETARPRPPTPAPGTRWGRRWVALTDRKRDLLGQMGEGLPC